MDVQDLHKTATALVTAVAIKDEEKSIQYGLALLVEFLVDTKRTADALERVAASQEAFVALNKAATA